MARQKRGAVRPAFDWAVRILESEDAPAAAAVRARVEALGQTPSGLGPEPLVTGDDLIATGMQPGPRFASMLATLYDAQLEDRLATKESGLEMARAMVQSAAGGESQSP